MPESERLMDASDPEKVDARLNATPEAAILWDSIPKSRLGLYVTLAVEVTVIAFLIVVVFIDIYIKHSGSLSTKDHALYVTGTTIIASVIATLGTSQIRSYWLARILPATEPADRSGVQESIVRGRTLLGLGTLQQQNQQRSVTFSMIVAGLTTAAIVAGISPTVSLLDQSLIAPLSYDDSSFDFYVSPNSSDGWFSWALSNGSYLNLNMSSITDIISSPIRTVQIFIDASSPFGFSYSTQGFAVDPLAIGIPYEAGGGGFPVEMGSWGPGSGGFSVLQSLVGCFPVLISNPVQCTRTGNLTVSSHEIITESDQCRVTSPIFAVNPTSQPASSLGACTHNQLVGKSTLVVGSLYEHAH